MKNFSTDNLLNFTVYTEDNLKIIRRDKVYHVE